MIQCSEKAYAMCPESHLCGLRRDAVFTENSECAEFNRHVEDLPITMETTNAERLIDANVLISDLRSFKGLGAIVAETLVRFVKKQPTVDAVEVDDMREFAEDVAYQFGYYCQYGGRLHITHGGLSTLEQAFDILGWKNPHPVPECECEIDGCHEHATCGAPTIDGYKRMCGRHYRERKDNEK